MRKTMRHNEPNGNAGELVSELNKASEMVLFSLFYKRLSEFAGKGRVVPRRQDAGGGPEQGEG